MNMPDNSDKRISPEDSRLAKMRLVRWIIGAILLAGSITAVILLDKNIEFLHPKSWDSRLVGVYKYSLMAILLCSAFCLFRVIKGPTAPDRAVALDMVGTLIVGICAILGIVSKRGWYIDIGIIWALQSFIGSLALAKYLEGRKLDE